MGLFSSKARTRPCPICSAALDDKTSALNLSGHWMAHVEQIPPGQGDASGQYTWRCACGPAGMKWDRDFAAQAALALHMTERHGFRL